MTTDCIVVIVVSEQRGVMVEREHCGCVNPKKASRQRATPCAYGINRPSTLLLHTFYILPLPLELSSPFTLDQALDTLLPSLSTTHSFFGFHDLVLPPKKDTFFSVDFSLQILCMANFSNVLLLRGPII
jgi:hypothetical protein